MSAAPVDYAALAKKAGAVASYPSDQTQTVDYAALAKKAGAIQSDPPPAPASAAQPQQDDSGFLSNLGSDLWNAAKGVASLARPPQNAQEWADFAASPAGVLMKRAASGYMDAVSQNMDRVHAAADRGDKTGVVINSFAAGLPLVGPLASGLYEDAQRGDKSVAGQLGTGASRIVQAASMAPEGSVIPNPLTPLARMTGAAIAKLPMKQLLNSPIADTLAKPRGATAAEAATPLELKAYADQNGIPLNAAQATEHNLPRNLQSAGERATVGGTAVKRQISDAQAAVADHVEKLAQQFAPGTGDNAEIGAGIKQNVQSALNNAKSDLNSQYQAIDQNANGVKVDSAPFKQVAGQIKAESSFIRGKVPSLDAKRVSGILGDITAQREVSPSSILGPNGQPATPAGFVDVLPDKITFEQAQQLRSALLDEAMHPDVAISDVAQARIKRLVGAVDGAMQQAASTDPALMRQFRSANAGWESLQDAFNNPRSPLAQILQEPDPSKVAQKLTAKGQTGGSAYNSKLLDSYGIDKGAVKRAVLQDIASRDFGLFKNKSLAGYSDEYLRSLFTPEELDQIYKTGTIARSVGMQSNPSGTAVVKGAMEDVQRPVRSLVPKAGAAALTNETNWFGRNFNKWLMGELKGPNFQAYAKMSPAQLKQAYLAAVAASQSGQETQSTQ